MKYYYGTVLANKYRFYQAVRAKKLTQSTELNEIIYLQKHL